MFLPRLRFLLPRARAFSSTPACKRDPWLPARPKVLDESEITEAFLKGSGPGGQKINKTSSAVQLIHKPTGLVVKCQETRSRSQNRKIARQLMAKKLDIHENGEYSYARLKEAEMRKRNASASKKKRRKYREKVEWLKDEEPSAFRDTNGRLVQNIVNETLIGEEIMAKNGRRITISSKPVKQQFWDADQPGIYEVRRAGGVEGWEGVKAGVEEDDRVLVYRGYSGADYDATAKENEAAAVGRRKRSKKPKLLEGEDGEPKGKPKEELNEELKGELNELKEGPGEGPRKYIQYLPIGPHGKGWLKVLKTEGTDEIEVLAELRVQPQKTQTVDTGPPQGEERREYWREVVTRKQKLKEAIKENKEEEFMRNIVQTKKQEKEAKAAARAKRKEEHEKKKAEMGKKR